MQKTRCGWLNTDPLYIDYHDQEWGVPSHDERHLFEMLCLEGQQAGLSWITILKKRDGYRDAFFNFDPKKIVQLSDEDIELLLLNPQIVRNRLKVNAIILNAQALLNMREQGENFVDFLWSFAPKDPCAVRFEDYQFYPTQTPHSEQLSKALKKKGFRFVGATTCYAFMQAVGMVDDHSMHCFCANK